MRRSGVEGLCVTSLPNIRYLTGFSGSSAALLIGRRGGTFFTDSRYQLQAQREVEGMRLRVVGARDLCGAIAAEVRGRGIGVLGFEAEALSYASHRRLTHALKGVCRLLPVPPCVERLRMLKDPGEIKTLQNLARMTDDALERLKNHVRAGMTERELAERLERCAVEAGAEGLAFEPIVASGPDSAMPHCRPGRGRIGNGKPLVIDFGLKRCGYNSDLTRTFHLGRVTGRYREVYEAVREAQQLALQLIKPGVAASVVDARARDHISSRGFGRYFDHSLGHGIGLEVHEAPRLNRDSDEILEEGMVCTVEPGIYLTGWGGVRIEDMVLVERGGCRVLTSSAKGIEDSLL